VCWYCVEDGTQLLRQTINQVVSRQIVLGRQLSVRF